MGKIEKLITKFKSKPKDLTWEELKRVLAYYGFGEINKKGKTGGSRIKFSDVEKRSLTCTNRIQPIL